MNFLPRPNDSFSSRLRGSLTYANVMATAAVFIALSGSAYAAAKINGKNIKKSTVSGKALKKDTLGGREIKESRLGKVPASVNADSALTALTANSAARATDADKVNGSSITRINSSSLAEATPVVTELLKLGSLTLSASCSVANDFPTLSVKSTANNAIVSSSYWAVGTTVTGHSFDGDLDANETSSLSNGGLAFSTNYAISLRNADGSAASVQLSGIKNSIGGGLYRCYYTGAAIGT